MDFTELVGFLISLLAFFVLIGKPIWEEILRRKNPKEYEEKKRKREENLKKFLGDLSEDMEEDELLDQIQPPPLPSPNQPMLKPDVEDYRKPETRRLIRDDFTPYKTPYDVYQKKTAIEERNFQTSVEQEVAEKFGDPYGVHIVSEDMRKATTDQGPATVTLTPPPRIKQAINRLSTRRDMVIYNEIMRPPKALQKWM